MPIANARNELGRKCRQRRQPRPHDDHGFDALRLKAAENTDRAAGIARYRRIGKLVDVVAAAVRNGVTDVAGRDFSFTEQKAQLLDFLSGRKQITLDAVSDHRDGLAVGLQARSAHAVCNPPRQLAH
jgi:hypothetical protein